MSYNVSIWGCKHNLDIKTYQESQNEPRVNLLCVQVICSVFRGLIPGTFHFHLNVPAY